MMRRTIGLALATLALTVTSACGGSSSDGDKDAASDAKTSSTPSASSPSPSAGSATTPAPVKSVDPNKRPTAKQLAETLKSAGLTEKQATCFSKQLVDSSLSDKLLAALVNRDGSYKPSAKETAAYQKIAQGAATTCS
ncbi:hypothetical protein GEV29_09775 [Aeromicrobium sp. SMF47]|uniref:Uncharacterized protein n=1 Tax=Aeromicrobium yanjiei TaxID=2662028 RepID=A0A5Q2MJV7_9ACTN|nr:MULTISPECIES: hypothetical protein [Aeromicrobium]MRJ76825.1 hypothetical protein [Aeromicrobium yanjiei]MRK01169.1 hypothetical protein [Aeromicrobium sp. S22]QGG42041.1 hypothetical protein GEV26_12050 [Aeromicrobium yanjiei]